MDLYHLKCQQNDKYYEKENLLICFNKLDIFFLHLSILCFRSEKKETNYIFLSLRKDKSLKSKMR